MYRHRVLQPEVREVMADVAVQVEGAGIGQLHGSERGQRLRHRSDTEPRACGLDVDVRVEASLSIAPQENDASVVHHDDRRASDMLLGHQPGTVASRNAGSVWIVSGFNRCISSIGDRADRLTFSAQVHADRPLARSQRCPS